jgi:hypothetical protein
MNPKFPVYVISKGRWESRLTHKALLVRGIPHRVVIEPQERDAYAAVIDPATLLVLPFSNLGQGSIPARNWVWEHSIAEGHERHWILDDNIRTFYRLWKNLKVRTSDGTTFAAVEDFVLRYEKVALASMQYQFLAKRKQVLLPIIFNTRIYSCILILNRLPYRWRGRYNEDTDLSLRVLKDGWATAEFNAFLCEKQATMTMGGGQHRRALRGRWPLENGAVPRCPASRRDQNRLEMGPSPALRQLSPVQEKQTHPQAGPRHSDRPE